MSMATLMAIGVEIYMIDYGCPLKKEFIELIGMNPSMLLYLTINHIDSCHGCVSGWILKEFLAEIFLFTLYLSTTNLKIVQEILYFMDR